MSNCWLMKSEPDEYGWDDLVAEKEGTWDGVKNAQASNNMKAMKKGDQVFFYHSRQGLEIVGIMEVTEEQFPDPFDDTGRWIAVKVKPVRKLDNPVPLKAMKQNPKLANLAIIRQTRLSVAPVTAAEWDEILAMSA
ncbi:Predicted RNA-binding protein, contains PUA-like domain [Parasphingorhabdus marina DSM 22363]|uniref:Predicted RNA-binding protein, contains PUA-like domain n=1 Tax=Parasphingorhabdus marina DSM 22363 TaxID=1123272 RepID=A0A1N6CXN7_9SPHN|nr:EVE domain-containing protein [Parasphingorhabdus marina]SIN63174.1 Predicted RNA-binding protein, contains PUA-like domain [Parasphingorhabdus marina DSM 22363]